MGSQLLLLFAQLGDAVNIFDMSVPLALGRREQLSEHESLREAWLMRLEREAERFERETRAHSSSGGVHGCCGQGCNRLVTAEGRMRQEVSRSRRAETVERHEMVVGLIEHARHQEWLADRRGQVQSEQQVIRDFEVDFLLFELG